MTATVLAARSSATAYRAEDEAITRAQAVLDQTGAGTWTGEAAQAVSEASEAVEAAIETHRGLRKPGGLGWKDYDPDLRVYAELARHSIAITKSAEDAEELAGYLAEVIGRYSKGEQS